MEPDVIPLFIAGVSLYFRYNPLPIKNGAIDPDNSRIAINHEIFSSLILDMEQNRCQAGEVPGVTGGISTHKRKTPRIPADSQEYE